MKRRIAALSLCLLLAGCGAIPEPETVTVSLPTLVPPTAPPMQELDSPSHEAIQPIQAFSCHLGDSFSELSRQVGEDAVFPHWNCLIWTTEAVPVYNSISPEQLMSDSSLRTPSVWAALSGDCETVTGLITWAQRADGSWTCASDGIDPLEPVEDPAALNGLSAEALEEQLGPCHFDMGSGLFIPCWFTRDGKLIVLHPTNGLSIDELLPLDPDTISPSEPYRTNLARWDAFLETTARGEPDQVTLRLAYSDEIYGYTGGQLPVHEDLLVTYNGKVYEVTPKILLYVSSVSPEDEISRFYSYLIMDAETGSRFQTLDPETEGVSLVKPKIHYLLSNDPDMTWERYWNHLLSDTSDPSFPDTVELFFVCQTDAPAP